MRAGTRWLKHRKERTREAHAALRPTWAKMQSAAQIATPSECRVHEDREGALIVLVTDENQSNEQVAAGVKEQAVAAITFPRRVFLVLV